MPNTTSSFVRKLAHNDAAVRLAAFDALKNFLKSKSSAKLDLLEMEKLWKGLYYSMWYCDKPIPQQNLAGNLGNLFSEVIPENKLEVFHEAFWVVMIKEWPSLDKWRLDKFYMLIRRVLRHQFFRMAAAEWPEKQVESFLAVLEKYPINENPKFPKSLAYHVCDIYLNEIEYVIFKDFRDYTEEIDDEEEDSDDEDDEEEKEEKEEEKKVKLTEEEIEQKKEEIVAKTPIVKLISPFQKLVTSGKFKPLKEKIREEILDDERLKIWRAVEDEEADSDEDEWTGF